VTVTADRSEVAAVLARAAREREPVPPFTDADEHFGVADAYAVQELVVGDRVEGGARLIGAKLGLTSRAKQEQMSVHEPISGALTSDMVLSENEPVDLERFLHPRAEPEIGFQLGRELAGPTTVADVLAATESVFAAVEIIDSRYAGFRFRLPDVVADNASSAGIVICGRRRRPDQLEDLRLLGCVLRVDGQVHGTAAGAAVLGHPAQSVVWLVDQLGARGRSLPAGSIVLAGALTDAVELRRGTVVTAEIGELGTVEICAS
jgi:2-oxo-3-hexenedioate decarboxylase